MPSRPKVFKTAIEKDIEDASVIEEIFAEAPPDENFRDEFPLMTTNLSLPVIAEVYETVTLKLPKSVYDEYARLAAAQEMTIEDLMQYRLSKCKNHNALRGIWFSDSERTQLENILQKWPLETASQALSLLAKAGTVKIDDVEISLSPAQKRTLGFAMYGGRTPKAFFEAMIKKELRTA